MTTPHERPPGLSTDAPSTDAPARTALLAELARTWDLKPDLRFGQMAAVVAMIAEGETGTEQEAVHDEPFLEAATEFREDAARSIAAGSPPVDPARDDYVPPELRRELLERLGSLWELAPTLRFGQLVCNLTTTAGGWAPGDQWDLEDERLLRAVRQMEAEFRLRRDRQRTARRELERLERDLAAAA